MHVTVGSRGKGWANLDLCAVLPTAKLLKCSGIQSTYVSSLPPSA